MLADEPFAKAMKIFETCVLANNNLWGKSSESPITFDKCSKVTLVPFFIPDFNLLSCESHDLTFKELY